MKIKLKNILLALKYQMPIHRAFVNFFITGNAWGMFSKNSHYRNGDINKPKVMYNTYKTAKKSADDMEKKYNKHFSIYKCVYCNGFHLGKNMDNK